MYFFARPISYVLAISALPFLALAEPVGSRADSPYAEFSQTLERPLFSKTRTAYQKPVAKVAPKPKTKPRTDAVLVSAPKKEVVEPVLNPSDLLLNGVVTRGTRTMALIEQRYDGSSILLETGKVQLLSGSGNEVDVEVTAITQDSITIFAGVPLVFKLRGEASRDGIHVERATNSADLYAMIEDWPSVRPKVLLEGRAAYMVPLGVTQNTGFTVGDAPAE